MSLIPVIVGQMKKDKVPSIPTSERKSGHHSKCV